MSLLMLKSILTTLIVVLALGQGVSGLRIIGRFQRWSAPVKTLRFGHRLVGDAALLFDPHDPKDIAQCIMKLLFDENIANRLRKKGIERAKLFSQSKSAAKHLEIFRIAVPSYRKRRYFYYKYLYEPIHKSKMYCKRRIIERSDKTFGF